MEKGKIVTQKVPINLMMLQMVFVSIIWGGTFIAGRVLQTDISPLLSATIRFIFASIALISLLSLTKIGWKKITLSQLGQIMLLGTSGIFVYQILFFYGLQVIPASRAALLVAINPAMIALISFLLWKEKVTQIKGVGILLCVTGAVILLSDQSSDTRGFLTNKGDLAILGCVVSWGIYTVAGKHVIREVGALHTVTYAVLFGTLLLILVSGMTGVLTIEGITHLSSNDFISLVYLGILGSALAYVWYYQGVDKLGAANAGSFIALNPLTAVIIGTLFLNEKITAMVLLGGCVIVLGLVITNRKSTDK
ncbi:EamA family transporter [Providencia rustigianii]|uniref:DMT family transporter n=1 Tax=Providencia rustigianii TaxID=158850 RepID=UPI000F6B7CBE|nr:EamA family transporter [Providencia rustigianii]MTC61058.1 EamA family transporter [Providencia rustigianii]VEH55473.1 putative DMT superfamily transporter inner membrane protein [Providencia rustigianii]